MSELAKDSDLVMVCPECMTTGFTVSLSFVCVHMTCSECQSLYSLSIPELAKDVYECANDAGLLIASAVSN